MSIAIGKTDDANNKGHGKIIEILAMVGLMLLYLSMCFFHEPWYDEVQAWQIAKYASIKEILTYYPHFEGHPAFWYLLLAIPAKLGVDFEIALKTIGGILAAIVGYLLLFKMRFPRIIRLVLPFTYFVFYQYLVIVRPYSILLIALLLASIEFDKKNEKPWKFAVCLALMCMTCGYGIVIAGGIAIAWCIDILTEYGLADFAKRIWKDKRFFPLLALLIVAIFSVVSIVPDKAAFAMAKQEENNSLLGRLVFCLIGILGDNTITDTTFSDIYLYLADFSKGMLFSCTAVGLIVWFFIIFFSSKKNLKYFVIPFTLFGVFSSIVYITAHHFGMVYFLLIFWGNIAVCDGEKYEFFSSKKDLINNATKILPLFVGGSLIVAMIWSIQSIYLDIRYPYSFGKDLAAFISDNNLDELKIMTHWQDSQIKELVALELGQELSEDELRALVDTNNYGTPSAFMVYFDKNICFNLNGGRDDLPFELNRVASFEENEENIAMWRQAGIPDVLIYHPDIESVYGDQISFRDYAPVYEITQSHVWKGKRDESHEYLYLRRDLLEKYNFREVEKDILIY